MLKNATTADMKTLSSCHTKLLQDGFTENFKASESGLLSPGQERIYKAEEVADVNFYRFEGASDPGDNAILYAIETTDGVKGTLVDAYGTYHDENIDKFMKEVETLHKKPVHQNSNPN